MKQTLVIVFLILLTACAPAAAPTPQVINIYASAAAQPWLAEAFACATQVNATLIVSDSALRADVALRFGEPEILDVPAYQIGSDDLLFITHRQSPAQNMDASRMRAVFAGQSDLPVQVWVYASGEDIQQLFERAIMQGTPISTQARLAVSAQTMSDTINAETDAVGFVPRRWKAGDVRDIFTLPNVPVLAITTSQPQGALQELITCLQH